MTAPTSMPGPWGTADEKFRSFLTSLNPETPHLDRAAHFSAIEVRMLGRLR